MAPFAQLDAELRRRPRADHVGQANRLAEHGGKPTVDMHHGHVSLGAPQLLATGQLDDADRVLVCLRADVKGAAAGAVGLDVDDGLAVLEREAPFAGRRARAPFDKARLVGVGGSVAIDVERERKGAVATRACQLLGVKAHDARSTRGAITQNGRCERAGVEGDVAWLSVEYRQQHRHDVVARGVLQHDVERNLDRARCRHRG
jgi:hypothetical protein